ncbi:GTPase IMAP family member 4-like isoform X2 [Haliotis rufescens]|uniref:GTPase IMAP family member 4-like isoform X2 n=1 Tax=Haliotis rufescens TaxID=6454 RepID=UPI00201F83B6|nr:GTPase IMAP family member 4-like isoform X2 [Haliotis rufescens]
MADKGNRSSFLDREIRMVLVGKTRVGKSETGNTIAGVRTFVKTFASLSFTKNCKQHSFNRFGYDLQLVDVPGLCDTVKSHDDIKKEIMKCVALSSPGIHAVLFIVRIGRFTEEDKNTLETFLRCFGEGAKRFVIVVFTGKDDSDADNDTLDNYLDDCPVTLKKFLFDVSGRCIAVNNRGTDAEKEKFTRDLIDMIKIMVGDNGGRCYTNEMYERCEADLREAEKMVKLEENREKQTEEKLKQEAAAFDEKLQSQHLKKQELERQLQQNERRSEETKDEENQLRERLKALELWQKEEEKKKSYEDEKNRIAEQKEAAAEENMRREVQKLKDLQRTFREEHEHMREEHERMREEHERMREEHERMREEQERMRQEQERMREEHERMREEHERMREEHERMREEHERMREEHERMREEHEHMREEHERMREEHERMRQEHERMREEHEHMREEHERMREEHERMREEHERMREEHERMREEHEHMRQEMRHEEALKQIREKVEKGDTSYLGTAYQWVKSLIGSLNPFS